MDISFFIPVARAAEEASASGVLGTFGLNVSWFIGQLINFAIVVVVFWKWVIPLIYKRLEARGQYIATSLEQAQEIEKQHKELARTKQRVLQEIETQAALDLQERKAQAEQLIKNLIEAARAEQDEMLTKTKKMLEQEREQAIGEFKKDMAGLVVAATQKIVQEKLDLQKDKVLIKKILSEVGVI